jgi:hypothetical protein
MEVTIYVDNLWDYLLMLAWLNDNIGPPGTGWRYQNARNTNGRDCGRIKIDDVKKALWFQLIWG